MKFRRFTAILGVACLLLMVKAYAATATDVFDDAGNATWRTYQNLVKGPTVDANGVLMVSSPDKVFGTAIYKVDGAENVTVSYYTPMSFFAQTDASGKVYVPGGGSIPIYISPQSPFTQYIKVGDAWQYLVYNAKAWQYEFAPVLQTDNGYKSALQRSGISIKAGPNENSLTELDYSLGSSSKTQYIGFSLNYETVSLTLPAGTKVVSVTVNVDPFSIEKAAPSGARPCYSSSLAKVIFTGANLTLPGASQSAAPASTTPGGAAASSSSSPSVASSSSSSSSYASQTDFQTKASSESAPAAPSSSSSSSKSSSVKASSEKSSSSKASSEKSSSEKSSSSSAAKSSAASSSAKSSSSNSKLPSASAKSGSSASSRATSRGTLSSASGAAAGGASMDESSSGEESAVAVMALAEGQKDKGNSTLATVYIVSIAAVICTAVVIRAFVGKKKKEEK